MTVVCLDLCADLDMRQRLVEIIEELASKRLSMKNIERVTSSRASTMSNRRASSVRR